MEFAIIGACALAYGLVIWGFIRAAEKSPIEDAQ